MRASFVLAPFGLLLAATNLSGCAKFPADGAGNQYTRLTFRFTMADTINPRYIYAVAIRTFMRGDIDGNGNPLVDKDGTPTNTDAYGPVPVLSYNNSGQNPNGFVAGRPTRLVLYNPDVANQYLVYRFQPTGTPNDPVSLSYQPSGDIITNSGIDPSNPAPGIDPNTLGFTIDTARLVDNPSQAQEVVGIQFNIITTNKPLLSPSDENSRGTDAIGDQKDLSQNTLNAYFPVSLLTSDTYPKGNSVVIERTGDVYGVSQPAIDMQSWSLRVDRA